MPDFASAAPFSLAARSLCCARPNPADDSRHDVGVRQQWRVRTGGRAHGSPPL